MATVAGPQCDHWLTMCPQDPTPGLTPGPGMLHAAVWVKLNNYQTKYSLRCDGKFVYNKNQFFCIFQDLYIHLLATDQIAHLIFEIQQLVFKI